MSKLERIREMRADMGETLPNVRMTSARDSHNPLMIRSPVGIASIDLAIGGGLPPGPVEFCGPENSGKNVLCNSAMAMNQSLHGENSAIALISTEGPWDMNLSRKMKVTMPYSESEICALESQAGYDFSDSVKGELQQEMGIVELVRASTAEEILESVIKLIEIDEFQIIVLDSIAGLLTHEEGTHALVERKMLSMEIPRVMARFFRRANEAWLNEPHGRPNLTTLIFTNQLMARVGGFSNPNLPPPTQTKGGWATKHSKLLSISLKRGTWINTGRTKIGHEIKWQIVKGKAGCADGAAGALQFHTTEDNFGVDVKMDTLTAAQTCGIVIRRGAYYDIPCAGIENKRGKDSALRALEQWDPNWEIKLQPEIIRASGLHVYSTWSEVQDS